MTEEEFKIAKRRGNIAAIIGGIIMIMLFMNTQRLPMILVYL